MGKFDKFNKERVMKLLYVCKAYYAYMQSPKGAYEWKSYIGFLCYVVVISLVIYYLLSGG